MAAEGELLPKAETVQELAISGKPPPQNYLHKEIGITDAASVPLIHIPLLDFGLLSSASHPSASIISQQEVEKLGSALRSFGCCQVINHGMTSSFFDQIRGVAKEFFAYPMEEKLKYSREADAIEGYGNDMVLSENQKLDWSDRLYLTLTPQQERQLKFWPQKPQAFMEILEEYTTRLQEIVRVLLISMARSVSLRDNSFLEQYGEDAMMFARYNYYPPCPMPDSILGLKPHADGSVITVLLQDSEVEGLQVLQDNRWFKVPIIPHALFINVGDQLEIMSNGMFKSPVHRVVTNSERERITMAVFCAPQPDREIGPVDSLVNEKMPRLYKKMKDYVSTYFQYFQQGKRPIEAVKL